MRFALLSLLLIACSAQGSPHHGVDPRHGGARTPLSSPTSSTAHTLLHTPEVSRSETVPRQVDASRLTGDWQSEVLKLPWDTATALRIVGCESGGRPWVVNPTSGAAGLFQILGGPLDPIANVDLAFSMWRVRGWQPWVSSRRCWGG